MSEFVERPQRRSAALWPIFFVWLLFSGVSLLGTSVPGVNEPHYVCKARSLVIPDWCERDFFLRSANVHWCFLLLTGWWSVWSSFGAVVIAGRLLQSLVLAFGFVRLSGAVGLSGWGGVISAAIFALLTQLGSFSGEWILGGYESKVPAWGLGWAALGMWIEGSVRRCPRTLCIAGLCCGLGVSLHPVVGGWFGLGIGGGCFIWVICRGHLKTELVGLGMFGLASVLAASPGLIPAIRFLLTGGEQATVRDRSIFVQVYWRLRHHMDPTAIMLEQWCYAGALLGVIVALGILLQRGTRFRSEFARGADPESLLRLQLVLLVAITAAAAGVLLGWHESSVERMTDWQWRGRLLRFYPFRFFDGMLPVVAAMTAVLAAGMRLRGSEERRGDTESPALPRETTAPGLIRFVCLPVLFLAAWGLALSERRDVPAGYSAAGWRDWRAACQWLRANTEKSALVLTPRESFAFKWLSERAEYVCYKDCPQDPAGIVEWDQRLWRVHQWSAESLRDGRYDAGDCARLRVQMGCDYVLIRGQEPFEAVPEWAGEYWKIYRIH